MDPRLTFVTLVVRDLDASRAFYCEGLGWPAELDVPGDVVMIRVGEKLMLSMWSAESAEKELGPVGRSEGALPFTLAHNVATRKLVDSALAQAKLAGASIASPGVERDWGGYSGYFADPDGFRWEVAYNPHPLGLSVL